YHCAESIACIAPIRDESTPPSPSVQSTFSNSSNHQVSQNMHLGAETTEKIYQLLAQGYRIGTEHADERRFQTCSWKSCAPIQSTQHAQVLAELESCLAEHAGEYVRLIGIDPKAKRRVLEAIIQRPGDQPGQFSRAATSSASSSSFQSSAQSAGLNPATVTQIRQLLSQGHKVGAEYADKRRFQTTSWQSYPINAQNESGIIAALQECLGNHQGEYVRLIGIDPKAKRRVLETIIQRPDDQPVPVSGSNGRSSSSASGQSFGSGGQFGAEVVNQVRQLLAQGYQISTEYADERRFKTTSWYSGGVIKSNRDSEVLAALAAVVAEQPNCYVRLIGVDPKAKRRVAETIVQRPNGQSPQGTSTGSTPASVAATPSYGSSTAVASQLSTEVVTQVRQLLAQGYQISTEYADERRFKTTSWQSGGVIKSNRESEVLSALATVLEEQPKSYVRVIGIDPKVKRRVLELMIQRPKS
ncbi:MAG: ribulose bisphosphate carboxylase small subunit, partial [Leptolyngbyaceae bacterium]|nr:ribulose bisphosphate carboxylase small subunit [Leptolyngbyaceae bacterium]